MTSDSQNPIKGSDEKKLTQPTVPDSVGHYDIDGVSFWHNHVIVASAPPAPENEEGGSCPYAIPSNTQKQESRS